MNCGTPACELLISNGAMVMNAAPSTAPVHDSTPPITAATSGMSHTSDGLRLRRV